MLTLIRRGHRVPWALALSVLLTACGGGDLGGGTTSSGQATGPVAAETASSGSSNAPGGGETAPGNGSPSTGSGDTGTGGTGGSGTPDASSNPAPIVVNPPVATVPPTTVVADTPAQTDRLDAHRLAQQATFGPSEALITEISAMGPRAWVEAQLGQRASLYTSGGDDAVDRHTDRNSNFCDGKGEACFKEYLSSEPLLRDFYASALHKPDQLRQRVAFALGQIFVISSVGSDVRGTYGFRLYHNTLLQGAFGNLRELLRKVTLSPMMGDYLNHVNNDKEAPNENYARELMQLFSIGLCELNADGTLKDGRCIPTYDNQTVREVAYALTGWTYAPGGASPWGCPKGFNCRYLGSDMVPVPEAHDTAERHLLSGVVVPADSTPAVALEKVLDSLMAHPNIGPFFSRQLIQHLVKSNPSPTYVARVVSAFNSGIYFGIGSGVKGDLGATVAAVLLDPEARKTSIESRDGSLREPVLYLTGILRAFGGRIQSGEPLGYWWGDSLGQHVFMSPSVFNFYPPDYHVPGQAADIMGPAFGVHTAPSAIARMNYLNCTLYWKPVCSSEMAIDLNDWVSAYVADGAPNQNPTPRTSADEKLLDRLSKLAYGHVLADPDRADLLKTFDVPWSDPESRLRTAAFLVFAHPLYQVMH